MIVVYSIRRWYRLSWGVASPSASKSFLNPPATMFKNIRRPYKKPAVETIFATEYGCM